MPHEAMTKIRHNIKFITRGVVSDDLGITKRCCNDPIIPASRGCKDINSFFDDDNDVLLINHWHNEHIKANMI